jgi:hypothetical protein
MLGKRNQRQAANSHSQVKYVISLNFPYYLEGQQKEMAS